jgi:membrane protease YdiL (CAAX protease family)
MLAAGFLNWKAWMRGILMSETTVSFSVSPPVKRASLYEAALFFAATSLLFFACLYLLLPFLRLHHISWFTTYNLVLAAPMFMLVGCAFLAYHLEGRRLRWPDVRDRFRLRKMSLNTWLWTAALTIFMFGGRYASLSAFILVLVSLGFERSADLKRRAKMAFGVAAFLALTWGIWQAQPVLGRIPIHTLPPSLQDFLAQFAPTAFMGIPLHGQWCIALYYILVLLFGNIAGEELWWRGYLLPRQEAASGPFAWLFHGLLWAAFHLFFQATAWDMIRMMPTCCALAFVAQSRKNTWPGVVAHSVANSGFLIQILGGIVHS